MATQIGSLFGLQDPQRIEQDYLNQFLVSPAQMGQQNLLQQLVSTMSNAGANVGAAGARMLGGKLPEVVKQETINRTLKEVQSLGLKDQGSVYEELSKRLMAQGFAEEADLANKEAMDIKAKQMQMSSALRAQNLQDALTQIPANASVEEREQATRDAIFKFGTPDQQVALANELTKQAKTKAVVDQRKKTLKANLPQMEEEVINGIAADDAIYQEWGKTLFAAKASKRKVDYQTVGTRKMMYVTDDQGNIVKTVDLGEAPAAPKTTVEVKVDQRALGKYADTVGTEVAKQDVAFVESVDKAAETLPKIQQTLDLLTKGDVTTGIGAELILNVNRVRAQFLKDKKAGKSVSDTQVLDAALGSEVFPMIDSLGIGARGLDTPAEREFLRGVFTGTINMEKDTLIKLTQIRKNIAERALTKYNNRLKEGYFKTYQEALKRELKPYAIPTQSGAPTTSKGTKYTIIEE